MGKIYLTYTEDYADGRLIVGKSTDESGEAFTYMQRLIQPSFKGGLAGFGRYLGDGIRYPQLARNRREEGRVVVSFMVKTDGSLDGFKVIENPNQLMTDEAIRILKISPKWEPGVFYGKIVPVWYTVPVAFRL
ncbi:energy transducer TonB [Mucilaginibacter antarcticus]|uniref:energy transducer TonB n=1 Tax=Mucilaginibacter antarcticus TaxID=1855725 RepID=UPI0036335EA8